MLEKIHAVLEVKAPHEDCKGWKIKSFLAKKFGHSGKILILNNFGHL